MARITTGSLNPSRVHRDPDWARTNRHSADDELRRRVAAVAVGAYPDGVAANPTASRVYVTNNKSDSVLAIDTATNIDGYRLAGAVDARTALRKTKGFYRSSGAPPPPTQDRYRAFAKAANDQ